MKKIFGLIGYPLTHSWSPAYFQKRFQDEGFSHVSYQLFPLKRIDDFPALLKRMPDLCGVNVTIPYKEAILPFLDELDPTAREIGAVNTILIHKTETGRKLTGSNTDAAGFRDSADFSEVKAALILGTGGAAKAVAYALGRLNISHLFVSRTSYGERIVSYRDLDETILRTHTLIVNATPVGMYPDVDAAPPIPYSRITPDHFLYDLIYNPEPTQFLKNGIQKGARTQSGLKMLHLQAEITLQLFMGA